MGSNNKSQLIRQLVLVGVLVIVLAAFLYDKYVLIPSATEKINKITSEVSLRLSPENRDQVHEIVGFSPSATFEHNGIQVEQYRFPRGLPFFPKPVLDVAYDGDTLAFFRQEPIDNAYIDSQRPVTKINEELTEDPGQPQAMTLGGRRPPSNPEDGSDKKDDEDSDSGSDSEENEDEGQ